MSVYLSKQSATQTDIVYLFIQRQDKWRASCSRWEHVDRVALRDSDLRLLAATEQHPHLARISLLQSMVTFESVSWQPGGTDAPIVKDLSLTIPDGQFCCVVGPSGAGKTTLLRLAAGLLAASSGRVSVNGQRPEDARSSLSYVFQQPVLFPWRTVLENIRMPLELRGTERDVDLSEHLDLVRLNGSSDKFPRQLSGGMQSRVAIARALVTDPRLLLMDEPFADLDEINREHLNVELQRIWMTKRQTVVFVTHDLAEAVFLADRIVVLSTKPARLFADIAVSLPRPRGDETLDEPAFEAVLREVRHALRGAARATDTDAVVAT